MGVLRSLRARFRSYLQERARRREERRRELAMLALHGVTPGKHESMYKRLQSEAASRPESTSVPTSAGAIWMSPIESRLYEAMRIEGLAPTAQYCVSGYYVDFAFPEVRLAIEADGAAYHDGEDRRPTGWQTRLDPAQVRLAGDAVPRRDDPPQGGELRVRHPAGTERTTARMSVTSQSGPRDYGSGFGSRFRRRRKNNTRRNAAASTTATIAIAPALTPGGD